MVGTAVYQVGFASSSQAKKQQSIKSGATENAGARRDRCEHRSHQPMDVE